MSGKRIKIAFVSAVPYHISKSKIIRIIQSHKGIYISILSSENILAAAFTLS